MLTSCRRQRLTHRHRQMSTSRWSSAEESRRRRTRQRHCNRVNQSLRRMGDRYDRVWLVPPVYAVSAVEQCRNADGRLAARFIETTLRFTTLARSRRESSSFFPMQPPASRRHLPIGGNEAVPESHILGLHEHDFSMFHLRNAHDPHVIHCLDH